MAHNDFHNLLTTAFERQTGAIALETAERKWRYADLWEQVAQLERRLNAHLFPGGDRLPVVAVHLSRGVEAIAAMIAIMRAGGVYMPVELSLPPERMRFMLDDARPVAVIATGNRGDRLDCFAGLPLLSPGGVESLPDCASSRPSAVSLPAYLLYTSGSSGLPKGVMGTYRGLLNRITWMQRRYPFTAQETVCHRTSLGFVDSLCEILSPLAYGVPTVIAGEEVDSNTDLLLNLLQAYQVTRLTLVPSILRMILRHPNLDAAIASLRICAASGEVLPKGVALEFIQRFPGCRLLNFYGSTEVAADVTWHEVSQKDQDRPCIPIGRPISGVDIRILKADLSEAASGETGELFVFSNTAVADGYLHSPAENQGFLTNRFFSASGHTRVYRTGDLGFETDGLLFYAGRRDLTYKLAGRKVNLFEIEQLDDRLTVVVRAVNGVDKLVGIVCGMSESQFDDWVQSFFNSARSKLPDYMIPRLFCLLDSVPLTSSGKVDRQLLKIEGRRFRTAKAAAPDSTRNEIERQIYRIITDFLQLEHLGRDTNLFDAGLTSVEVPGLLAALNEFFTRQLTMTEFFEHASIAGIGNAVVMPIPASETVFVIDGQAGSTPLFLVHPAGGMAFAYRRLAGLVPGYRLYGLNSPYFGSDAKGYSNMHEMAAMYSRAIAGYHTGEPALAGWSFGGEVAYEMAVQLERKGGRARCLVLIDTARSEEVGQDSDPAIRRQYFVRNGIDPTSEFARTMSVDMQSHDAISVQYKPAPLKRTRVVLLKASESSSIDSHNGWLPYCKAGLRVVTVAGAHDYLLNEWHVKDLSRGLLAALEDSA